MGVITQVLGEVGFESFKMSQDIVPGKQRSLSGGVRPANPQVCFEDLEYAYKTDSINFNAVNKSVQMISSGGFKDFINVKKNIATKYRTFFDNIGYIGNDITFEELLKGIFKDEMVYGNAYIEKIFNEAETKIVDLVPIDPKKIDYAKTADGKIMLDKIGSPIGYMIKLESGTYAEGDVLSDNLEKQIKRGTNEIFLYAKRIAHFKLYTIGDKYYGIGLIEPSYKSGIYKKNIEKGQANSIYARGFSPLVAYIGNERRMATPQDIKGVLKQIQTLDYKRYGAFPEWVKIEPIKYEQSDLTTSALKDLRTDQISSLSAPQALVSGSGEATNRATLGDQRTLWEFTLKEIIKTTMSYFKKYILKPINDYNGYGGVPDTEWGELRAEDINQTADKIIKLLTAKSSHITPEFQVDLEEDLRELMNIKVSGKKPSKKMVAIDEETKKKDKKIDKTEKNVSELDSKLSNILEKIKLLEDDQD